jgi:hypothetical protein
MPKAIAIRRCVFLIELLSSHRLDVIETRYWRFLLKFVHTFQLVKSDTLHEDRSEFMITLVVILPSCSRAIPSKISLRESRKH